MDCADSDRKIWMGLLARAPEGRAVALMDAAALCQAVSELRPPEVGTVMIQGRAGGTGAVFNLGEMTVTRCTVKLACGAIGHGYVQGRRKSDARSAALIDALMQTKQAKTVQDAVLQHLQNEEAAHRAGRAEKAAATKVEFFTMARGED
ncbi:MAG: phosphonate C-P lyase system protein PhnG [Pseudomonadota bacterium]